MRLLSCSLLCALASPSLAQTLYVDDSALGAGTGASWQDAFVDLQSALAIAVDGDQVWVAQGTYRARLGLDRTESFVVPFGVQLLGGFAGTETSFAQRAELFEQTVLSADLLGDDGPGFTRRSDNSYHVLRAGGATMTLDGFRISGGNADGVRGADRVGGGLTVDLVFYGPIRNCIFEGNESLDGGGAIYSGFTAETYVSCTFVGNRSGGPGGAIWDNSTQTGFLAFENCGFFGNEAGGEGGGAMRLYGASFEGCVFSGNRAENCSLGGGALLGDSMYLSNCTLFGNSAIGSGQGTGGVLVEVPRTLDNCILWANEDSLGDTQGAQLRITVTDSVFHMAHSLLQGFDGSLSPDWNLASEPLLLDPDGADNVLGTRDDRPWPSSLSPCIDAADGSLYNGPGMDVTGGLRYVDALSCDGAAGVLDIGARENPNIRGVPSYCSGSVTSLGQAVALSADCAPSYAANDLVIGAGPVPAGFALLVAGSAPARVPFGQGELCVGGNLLRSNLAAGSGASVSFAIDLVASPWIAIEPASTWFLQVLVRDSGSSAGANTHTSEAWTLTFRP